MKVVLFALNASWSHSCLSDPDNEQVIAQVRAEVNAMMSERPMFAW